MGEKVKTKTTIVIDKELWYRFKAKLLEEGVEEVSYAIERLIKEEVLDDLASAMQSLLMGAGVVPLPEVRPVKPLVETDAGKVVREMRDESS